MPFGIHLFLVYKWKFSSLQLIIYISFGTLLFIVHIHGPHIFKSLVTFIRRFFIPLSMYRIHYNFKSLVKLVLESFILLVAWKVLYVFISFITLILRYFIPLVAYIVFYILELLILLIIGFFILYVHNSLCCWVARHTYLKCYISSIACNIIHF